MTTLNYSTQSILKDRTNNMSQEQKSAFAPFVNSNPQSFWTAYQKSLLELQQKQLQSVNKPVDLTSTPTR